MGTMGDSSEPENMQKNNEFQVKANVCISNVRRTFIFTFVVVLITLSVMYGTTEHISIRATSAFQSHHSSSLFQVNVSKILTSVNKSVEDGARVNADTKSDTASVGAQLIDHHLDITNIANTIVNKSKTLIDKGLDILDKNRNMLGEKIEKQDSGTNVVTSKQGSLEFPGMPDPCASPRRNTGVEDLLCTEPPKFLPEYKNPCWMDGGVFRCLPYFHLIGICKSGTSDFFKRLLLHPDIVPNKGIFGKEIWYWSWKRFYIKDRAGRFKLGMTLREFTQQFNADIIKKSIDQNGNHIKVTGHGDPMDIWDRFREEAIPQNTPGAEELLWTTPYAVRHINPNVKLLLMLRHPVDRLYSHYFHGRYGTSADTFHAHVVQSIGQWKKCTSEHSVRHCIYSDSFRSTMKAPIHTSFYIVHLREWLKAFPREQLFIFRNEDYSNDIKGTMKQILNHLKVDIPDESVLDRMKSLPHFYETKSKAKAGPMKPETRKLLVELYQPYTTELAEFLHDEKFAFQDRSFG